MKNSLLASFLILVAMNVIAQDKPVRPDTLLPEKVLKTFSTKYPGMPDSLWVKDGENYIITYSSEGKWYDIRISGEGKWLETLVLINYEDLPAPVKSNFEKSEFANLEQLKIEQLESEKTSLTYKLTLLSKSEDEIYVIYDAQGNRIMK